MPDPREGRPSRRPRQQRVLVGRNRVAHNGEMITHLRTAIATVVTVMAMPGLVNGQERPETQIAELLTEIPRATDSLTFLQNPVGAVRFHDGTVGVTDGMAQTVLIFDSRGTLVRSTGRAGEGPDEFSTPSWMGRCGPGTARVWDFNLMRFSEVHPSQGIVDQRRLQDVADVPRPPARLACSREGRMLLLLRLGGERIEGREVSVLTAPLYLVEPTGDTHLVNARAPVIEWLNEERNYRPVSPTTHFAITDSLLFLAHSDSATIHVQDLITGTTETWLIQGGRRRPTERHVRRDAETLTQFVWDRAARNEIIERYLGMEWPDYLPRFSGMQVDATGRLWIVLSVPGDERTLLHRYGSDGRLDQVVLVPVGMEVYEVGEDYVLGSRIDPETMEPKVLVYGFWRK